MRLIVVYDRQSEGNPIIGIHTKRVEREPLEVTDVYPDADPRQYGVVLVPRDIISQMTVRKYRRNGMGRVVTQPVLQEKTKDLVSVADSALGENILFFGEPYVEVKSVVDLAGKKAHPTSMNAQKGIIGLGQRSGHFTVTCEVDTGTRAPQVLSEEKNWEWERDEKGDIVGMKLIRNLPAEPKE